MGKGNDRMLVVVRDGADGRGVVHANYGRL